MFLLTGVLYWIVIGFLSYALAAYLDDIMDYGMILGGIRAGVVRRSQLMVDNLMTFEDEFNFIAMGRSFEERMNEMRDLYWAYAARRGWFTILLCRLCLSTWIAFGAWILISMYGDHFSVISLVYLYGGNYIGKTLIG